MKYLKNNKKSNSVLENKNGMWKGNNVGPQALHLWISLRKAKPQFCEICNKVPPIDLANISQEYKRDINDFEWLCRKCHMIKDGRLEKFMKLRESKYLQVLTKKCLCCKIDFNTKKVKQTTCSLSCSVRYRQANLNKREVLPLERKCVMCKNIFRPKRQDNVCCSKICANYYTNNKRWGFVKK